MSCTRSSRTRAGSITPWPMRTATITRIGSSAISAGSAAWSMGQHHHVSARYLAQYAQEAAWKEDHRRGVLSDAVPGTRQPRQPGLEGVLAAGSVRGPP